MVLVSHSGYFKLEPKLISMNGRDNMICKNKNIEGGIQSKHETYSGQIPRTKLISDVSWCLATTRLDLRKSKAFGLITCKNSHTFAFLKADKSQVIFFLSF